MGDIVKALSRATLQPGGQEALLYGTLTGAIGAAPPSHPARTHALACSQNPGQHVLVGSWS